MALLGVGTAQFGLDGYGVANRAGSTTTRQLHELVTFLCQQGMTTFDTAPAYGDSEIRLGTALHSQAVDNAQPAHSELGKRLRLISKTPLFDNPVIDASDCQQLSNSCQRSLQRLQRSSLYGLLIHRADDLLKPGASALWAQMCALKRQGYVEKIGVSVYDSQQLEPLLHLSELDLVQVPFNVLDRRLVHSGHLQQLCEREIEVHVRSVFLQGLLLMEPAARPPYFAPYRQRLDAFQTRARDCGLSLLAAALAPVLSQGEIDTVIVGGCSLPQWRSILEAAQVTLAADFFSDLACDDPALLNPSQWRC